MGVDLATVLAIMGTVWTGDPLSLDPSFSIGGRDPGVNNLLGNLGGLLGPYTIRDCANTLLTTTVHLCRRASRPHWLPQFH